MNGRYGHAKNSVERLAIAITAANEFWNKKHPGHFEKRILPGPGFYEEYLREFFAREEGEIVLSIIRYWIAKLTDYEITAMRQRNDSRTSAETKLREEL